MNAIRSGCSKAFRGFVGVAAAFLLAAPAVQAQNFGNFMNPGTWFGGSDRDRGYDDRYPRGAVPPGPGYAPYGAMPPHGQFPYGQQPPVGQPFGMQPFGAPHYGAQPFGVIPPTAPSVHPLGQPPLVQPVPGARMEMPADAAAQQRIRELEQRIEELERRQREPIRPMRPEFPEPEFPPLRY